MGSNPRNGHTAVCVYRCVCLEGCGCGGRNGGMLWRLDLKMGLRLLTDSIAWREKSFHAVVFKAVYRAVALMFAP